MKTHRRETSHHPDYPFFDELPYGYELEKVSQWSLVPCSPGKRVCAARGDKRLRWDAL